MSSISTLLVAHDFSETAALALRQAMALSKANEARLVLAHVVELVPLGPYPAIKGGANDLAIKDIAEQRTNEIAEEARTAGCEIEVIVRVGEPGPTIVEIAEEVGADLLVIGTRGLTGVKHVLLGSTAESVVRRAPMPVLTVHPDDALLDPPLETVLVPTDLSPAAEIAPHTFAGLFAVGPKPRVHLVYADRTPPYLEPFKHSVLELTGQPDPIKDDLLERMAPNAAALEDEGFPVECHVIDGEAADAIPAFAEKVSAQAIVLSTQGRSAVVNALLGRTAQRIVQKAPCPTLTVRARV